MSCEEVDYVIVGAGSAGCVLAERLSRDGTSSVAVIEAGGTDRRAHIKLPVGYGRTFFDERVNWKFQTDPIPGCGGRTSYWPRGKTIGGSSSINALVYCRGLPQDFDDWREQGAIGWGWEDVRPHFERIEHHVDVDGNVEGDGPLAVSDVSDRVHPVNRHFIEAAREIGMPTTADFNGPNPEGVGYYRINTRKGVRWSAADAFLRPALARDNIQLFKKAVAHKVVFRGRQASGVLFSREGTQMELRARREVILSAGAIGSPHLLQLSGIGPGQRLVEHGIDVVHDNHRVGGGLQDHVAVDYFYRATERTLNNDLASWMGKVRAGLTYALTRGGPLSLSVNQCGGFVRSLADSPRVDQQLYFTPATYTVAPSDKRPIVNPDPFSGFLVSFQPARPKSRGRVDLQSSRADVPPRIRPNYLSSAQDIEHVVAGGRLLKKLVRTDSLQRLIAESIPPNPEALDDDGLIEDFRQRCGSVFHPVSTCAMGRDGDSVTDRDLRVRGVSGLRVVDASVFPNITSGNTNAPTMMVADKAADVILADRRDRYNEVA